MNENEVRAKVEKVIAEHLGIDQAVLGGMADDDFSQHGDSLDLIEISMMIEDEFAVEFNDDVIESAGTMEKVINCFVEGVTGNVG